jgi:hypothetical protein
VGSHEDLVPFQPQDKVGKKSPLYLPFKKGERVRRPMGSVRPRKETLSEL